MNYIYITIWAIISFLIAYLIASRGYKKNSLSKDGAIAAFFVGWFTLLTSINMGIILISFFVFGSLLTKFGTKKKKKLEDDFKEGGQRNFVQVLSNSLPAVIFGMVWLILFGFRFTFQHTLFTDETYKHFMSTRTSFVTVFPDGSVKLLEMLFVGVIAHYACCCGDTFSSEYGILATYRPRLITQLSRPVPAGTNGGVTLHGLIASAVGGLCIGLVAFITASLSATFFILTNPHLFTHSIFTSMPADIYSILLQNQYYITLGLFNGVMGSLIDSLVGAIFQLSILNRKTGKVVANIPEGEKKENYEYICGFDILDNHQVNLLSSALTSFIAMYFQLVQ